MSLYLGSHKETKTVTVTRDEHGNLTINDNGYVIEIQSFTLQYMNEQQLGNMIADMLR